jgi:hypothetical protein
MIDEYLCIIMDKYALKEKPGELVEIKEVKVKVTRRRFDDSQA